MNIKITADSACDLGPMLIEKYQIGISPLTINLGDKAHTDGVDITPADIYAHVDGGGSLPSTAATNPSQYMEMFETYSKEYDAIVHIGLGSALSSCYQNARLAAAEFDNVYVVDSQNLSTGYGHVVLEAVDCAAKGMSGAEIAEHLETFVPRVRASFVLGRLDYMKKGGRCSTVAALGANLLKLKPSIGVREGGSMGVMKKYRGSMEKVLPEYVADQIKDREDVVLDRIFITHSGVSEEIIELVRAEVKKHQNFKEIYVTQAGCTISSHCGSDCLGVLFVVK
ncbi:MAG: DegV family protein [Oscillospiraceae bacterium]|nr:DegV family protein [Oscillospiraceae bacterium]